MLVKQILRAISPLGGPFRSITVAFISFVGVGAFAGGAEDFAIPWHSIDAGGGHSSGGDFSLVGTIGQPDAGGCTGDEFTLLGGFWPGAAANPSVAGDCNFDGGIDLIDHACLVECFTGPYQPITANCALFDLNGDNSVDLKDYTLVSTLFGNE